MLTAQLIVTATCAADLDELLTGRADIQIETVDAGVDGELVRHHLHPLSIEALTALASTDPSVERRGALVRIHTERPSEDE